MSHPTKQRVLYEGGVDRLGYLAARSELPEIVYATSEFALTAYGTLFQESVDPRLPPGPSAAAEQLRSAARTVTTLLESTCAEVSVSHVAHSTAERETAASKWGLPPGESLAVAPPFAFVLVGFDASVPALVRLPSTVELLSWAPTSDTIRPAGSSFRTATRGAVSETFSLDSRTSDRIWFLRAAARALDAIAAGEVRKIVLSRTACLKLPSPDGPRKVIEALLGDRSHSAVYRYDAWLGASPEVLVRKKGEVAEFEIAAGTGTLRGTFAQSAGPRPRMRGTDPGRARPRQAEPFGAGAGLLKNPKERLEHELAVRHAVDRIGVVASEMEVEAWPKVDRAGAVFHLKTKLRARVDPKLSPLELAALVHPTPSVCGTPPEAAYELASHIERHPRLYYAGLVGWVDSAGNGELAYVLRCARLNGTTAVLYAGAGLVAGSSPEAELAETEAKLQTIASAISTGSYTEN